MKGMWILIKLNVNYFLKAQVLKYFLGSTCRLMWLVQVDIMRHLNLDSATYIFFSNCLLFYPTIVQKNN